MRTFYGILCMVWFFLAISTLLQLNILGFSIAISFIICNINMIIKLDDRTKSSQKILKKIEEYRRPKLITIP